MIDNRKDVYYDRHKYWQEIVVSQLAGANNFMLSMSVGFLAFCFDKSIFEEMRFISEANPINWKLTFYFASLLCILFSILLGIVILNARLYDLRLIRNIDLFRQRYYEYNQMRIATEGECVALLPWEDLDCPHWRLQLRAILITLVSEMRLMKPSEAKEYDSDELIRMRFEVLRRHSFVLGTLSWKLPRWHALVLAFATVLYVASLIYTS